MISESGIAAARGDRAVNRLPPRLKPPGATADPARMASRILDALVPGFADAAGMGLLEGLLSDGTAACQPAGAGQGTLVMRRLASRCADADHPYLRGSFSTVEDVVVLGADSPTARCMREGVPVIFSWHGDRGTVQWVTAETGANIRDSTSFLAAPMITRGTVVGMLVLARAPGAPRFLPADKQAAADLAGRAAAAVADSLALMRHRSVAEALRAPRPSAGPLPGGPLEIAGRCLPATGCDAGGDWYDIIPLPGDRTGLVVGDVMGHGASAATVMTRLSAAAYALAELDLAPSEFMRYLNTTALALPQDTLVTCAYAVIDPVGQSCTMTAAGHLPPVLAMADGTSRVVSMPGGQSLGVAPADYGQARITLRPGTILGLYTDGLVETRTRPFDQGILALRSALSRPRGDLDATCEELVTAAGEIREDDITLVLARIPRSPSA